MCHIVVTAVDPALSDFGGEPVAQADPSASGTAIRRWFRSDESPALAQSHADSPAVARLRRLTFVTGNRCPAFLFAGPRLLEWKESHDPLLLHPANAVVDLYEGNAKRSR